MKIIEGFNSFTSNYLEVRQSSKITIDGYWWVIKSFIECNGNIETSAITSVSLNDWIRKMESKGNTRNTIISNLHRFKVFVGYLNLLNLCPLKKDEISVPRRSKALPKYTDKETVEKLIENASNVRDKALISLLFTSGLRAGEVRNLQISDVNGLEITVTEGKGLRDRITYIDLRTKELLDSYLSIRFDKCPYLFSSMRDQQLGKSTLRYIIDNTAKRAGLPHINPHMFRHGIATHMLQQGMNIRMIQKFLGHSNLTTTQIYLHVKDEELALMHQKCLEN